MNLNHIFDEKHKILKKTKYTYKKKNIKSNIIVKAIFKSILFSLTQNSDKGIFSNPADHSSQPSGDNLIHGFTTNDYNQT